MSNPGVFHVFSKVFFVHWPLDPVCRLVTRRSPLALWQTQSVASWIQAQSLAPRVDILPMDTPGDRLWQQQRIPGAAALAGSGKGLFVKALEEQLLDKKADLAVHSLKDLEAFDPSGLMIAAYLKSASPYDVLLYQGSVLKEGAVVGTASQRRAFQLKRWRPDLCVVELRGNVGTRLAKWQTGVIDALVMAEAGLERLGYGDLIRYRFTAEEMVPAVGQGIIAVQVRRDDAPLIAFLQGLNDSGTQKRVWIERAINQRMGGGCSLPLGIFADSVAPGCWRIRIRAGGDPPFWGDWIEEKQERAGMQEADYAEWGYELAEKCLSLARQ